jgi:hypothetical protein
MTSSGGSLDARLRGLYAGLDTSAGFDARVMARVRAQGDNKGDDEAAAARAARARAEESRPSERTKRGQSWQGWLRRWVSLDGVGAAALAGFLGRAVWPALADRAELISMYASQSVTALGVLLALATLPALLLNKKGRPAPRQSALY